MLLEVTQLIATEFGLTIGSNIYYAYRPEDSGDNCIAVLNRSGGTPDVDLQDRVDFVCQVIVRNTDYKTAEATAKEIYEFLNISNGIDLPVVNVGDEYTAMVISAIQYPHYLGIDDKKRHDISSNYVFKIRNK